MTISPEDFLIVFIVFLFFGSPWLVGYILNKIYKDDI